MGEIPTPAEAQLLEFASLARLIREELDRTIGALSTAQRRALGLLVNVLEGKAPPLPPQPLLEESPPEPAVPPRPVGPPPPLALAPKAATGPYSLSRCRSRLEALADRERHKPDKNRRQEMARLSALIDAAESWRQQSPLSEAWRQQTQLHEQWRELQARNGSRLSAWNEAVTRREASFQMRVVRHLRRDLAAGQPLPSAERVSWMFFPTDGNGQQHLLGALREVARNRPDISFDLSRIEFALGLGVDRCLRGLGEFDDYWAFVFAREGRVLLENPVEGNAAYVFGSAWRELSALSRTELLAEHRGDFVRVVHTGDWKSAIRNAIGVGRRDRISVSRR